MECKLIQLHWKTVWQFFTKLNKVLAYDPAVTLLGIHPNEQKVMSAQKPMHECL